MADGAETSNNNPSSGSGVDNETSDSEECVKALHLDLGDELAHSCDSSRMESNSRSSGPILNGAYSKREDNPFSFKHFLRSDSVGYHSKGARPKVYCEGRSVTSVSDLDFSDMQETKQPRTASEYSSALPDFVQDHLVVEQCYLGSTSNAKSSFDIDINLPDFTPSRDSINVNRINFDSGHIFNPKCDSDSPTSQNLPLRTHMGFPLDLPSVANNDTRNCLSGEVDISKRLPDFLADSAVLTHQADNLIEERPEQECVRLKQELLIARQHLIERTQQVNSLGRELDVARAKEQNYTRSLAEALEQVEQNLEKSNS